MGYAHIDNLYKDTTVLMFKRVYVLEKIHGTSAHISWNDGVLGFFAGGASHEAFIAIFNQAELTEKFTAMGHSKILIYGEAYGGKLQGMKATYGDKLRFVAFDVATNRFPSSTSPTFVSVPTAASIVGSLGLEFVDYKLVDATVESLNCERDLPSEQAFRNGCAKRDDASTWKKREGIVVRPEVEVYLAGRDNGRVIAKHKNAEFSERASGADTEVDPAKHALILAAEAAAEEWVTDTRLAHVLDKLGNPSELSATGNVVRAMVEDVLREGSGEVLDTKETRKAIGTKAAALFKKRVTTI